MYSLNDYTTTYKIEIKMHKKWYAQKQSIDI